MKNLKTLSNKIEALTNVNQAQQIVILVFIPLVIILVIKSFYIDRFVL